MAKKETRIKIKDLPTDVKMSREEMKRIFGGGHLVQRDLARLMTQVQREAEVIMSVLDTEMKTTSTEA